MHAPTPFSLQTIHFSFHRPAGTPAIPSIGSRNTVLAKCTSGTQIAHVTCAHRPSVVCLKAPPPLGHKQQPTGADGDS